MKQIAESEVDDIYLTRYANKILYDELPAGIDYATLDGAVNSGVSRGAKWLQSALGVSSDGKIGAGTISAIGLFGRRQRMWKRCRQEQRGSFSITIARVLRSVAGSHNT